MNIELRVITTAAKKTHVLVAQDTAEYQNTVCGRSSNGQTVVFSGVEQITCPTCRKRTLEFLPTYILFPKKAKVNYD